MSKRDLDTNASALTSTGVFHNDTERLSQLNQLSRALVRASDDAELYNVVLDSIQHFVTADRASILLFDARSQEAELVATNVGSQTVNYQVGTRWPLTSMSSSAAATDQAYSYAANLAESDSLMLQHLASKGLNSVLSAPLLIGDTVFGRLNVMSTQHNDYSEQDAQILIQIASIVAPMLHNLHLLRQANRRNSELEKTIEELKKLQKQDELRYLTQFALDSIPQAILWLNRQGHILHASQGVAKMFGYSAEELSGMMVIDIDPSYRVPDEEEWRAFQKSKFSTKETVLATRDGRPIPVEFQLSYLNYGEQEYLIAMISDISERRQMGIQLRRQLKEEELLRNVFALTVNSDDFLTTMEQLCQQMAQFYEIERSVFVLFNDEQSVGEVIAEFVSDGHASSIGLDVPIQGNPVLEYVLANRDVWVISDSQADTLPTPIRTKLADFCIATMFVVPIFVGDSLVGTIAFGSERQWKVESRDIELAKEVASQISNALYRIRILDKLLDTSRALESSQENLSEALGKLLIPICIVGPDGGYIYANEAFGRMLGTNAEHVMRNMVAPDIYVDPSERHRLLDELEQDGEVNNFRVQFRQVGGKVFWAATSVYVLQYYGESVLLSSVVDLSDRIQTEEILRKAKEEAEAANQTKSLFLSNMTHELRTPMNGVLGMTSLLLDTALDDQQHELVDTIRASGDTLLTIINDVLDFSKIEANKLELEQVDFELANTIDECVQLIQPTLQAKGLRFSIQIAADVPQWITQDVTRVRQVLTNLLTNATKFTEEGEINVTVSLDGASTHANGTTHVVRAPLSREANQSVMLHFAIEDTGIGIPVEQRDRLFQPFSQVDASTSRRYGGTGLGLVISRQLCELMGGKIWADSAVGRGSTFHFTVRAIPADAVQTDTNVLSAEQVLTQAENQPATNGSKSALQLAETYPLSILLAEDNVVNQKVALGILRKFGYSADVVANGLEVLNAVRRQKYDVILMDIQMPEMDGLQATTHIRRDWPEDEQPIIIALTANAMGHQREQYLSEGMDDFISKPIRLPELESALVCAAQSKSAEKGTNHRERELLYE